MMFILLSLIGCSYGQILSAPYGSSLQMPTDIEFGMDAAYEAAGDLTGGLFYAYIGVLGPDGMPLSDVQVEVTSGWTGAYIIAEKAVTVVRDYEIDCQQGMDDGSLDPSDPCYAWFDTEGEEFIEIEGDYAELGGFGPIFMSAMTDDRGLLPLYILVDSVAYSDGAALNIPIFASIGVETQSFQLSAVQ